MNSSKIPGVKIIPLKKWEDQRGWLCEIWRRDEIHPVEVPAMTYLSVTHPQAVRGPHEHVNQTDLFAFLGPSIFRLHLWDNRPDSETFGLYETFDGGEGEPFVAIVPPGVVHGYKNIGIVDGAVVNSANQLYKGEGRREEVDEIRHEVDPNSQFKIKHMKVLVLGARGMLGQEIVSVFSDHEVLAWDREDCDICNFFESENKIRKVAPELIINCAAYNNVDAAEGDGRELCFKLNAEAPANLARIAKELGANFVQYSSDYVFSGEKTDGYTEIDLPDPISEYGKSKAEGERLIQEIGGNFYIIRPSRIFGVKGTGENVKESFVDLIIRISAEKKEFNMVDSELTSPTYAPDLAARTREIIEKYPPGIYHGAHDGACTWHGFAEEIFRLLDRNDIKLIPVGSDFYPRPAKRPACSVLLNTKLPPARHWKEALGEYLEKLVKN
jgi:dTDP-4-dehydrorhamnose reductase